MPQGEERQGNQGQIAVLIISNSSVYSKSSHFNILPVAQFFCTLRKSYKAEKEPK